MTGPEMMEMEFEEAQAGWISFLRGLEPQFPGITGTARRLLATLNYAGKYVTLARG